MADTLRDIPEQCKAAQRATLLEGFKEHIRLTTSNIREGLGIFHPAGRVRDLKAAGHDIITEMGWHPDCDGKLHRQALYTYLGKEADHG